ALAHSNKPDDIIRIFKRSFRASRNPCPISSPNPSISPADHALAYFQEVFSLTAPLILDPLQFLSVGALEIASLFSPLTITDAISAYPSHKTCGGDSIHIKLLRALLPSSLPTLIAKMYQLCAITGLTPDRWNNSIIYPIPKKPTASTIEDFRPISITV